MRRLGLVTALAATVGLSACVQTKQYADLQFTPPQGDYKLLVLVVLELIRKLCAEVNAALMLVTILHQYPFVQSWLTVKVLLLVVYIVLGMLYESLVHPVTVLSTLPSVVNDGDGQTVNNGSVGVATIDVLPRLQLADCLADQEAAHAARALRLVDG